MNRKQAEQRDWLGEAATAYDEGDYDKAAAAAQIEIAAYMVAFPAIREELSQIGVALERKAG